MKFDPATLNILGNVSEPGLTEWLFFKSIWMPVFGGNVFTYVIYTYNIEKLFCKTSLFMLHSAGIELRTFNPFPGQNIHGVQFSWKFRTKYLR